MIISHTHIIITIIILIRSLLKREKEMVSIKCHQPTHGHIFLLLFLLWIKTGFCFIFWIDTYCFECLCVCSNLRLLSHFFLRGYDFCFLCNSLFLFVSYNYIIIKYTNIPLEHLKIYIMYLYLILNTTMANS